ncbi:MAG: P22 phage major capsid protein family protein [Hyphomicrobium sp.]
MSNRILNEKVSEGAIAKVALAHLENDLVIANLVHTDHSEEFAEKGDTINIRKPQRFVGQKDNLDLSGYVEDINEGKTQIKMDRTVSVKFTLDSKEMTLDVGTYAERWIKPAITVLKDAVESAIAELYADFYWFSGTPGTTPNSFLTLGKNGTILTNAACPTSPRYAVHDPDTSLVLADSLKGVFVQDKAKGAFEEAKIGRYAAFDNYQSVHIKRHTAGAQGGTPLVNGGAQDVTWSTAIGSSTVRDVGYSTLVTDGWSNSITGVLKKGDIFTIAGVYAVNPVTRQSTGSLQTFVVTADVDSSGAGAATLSIMPPIIASGQYKTVSAVPADNAAITVKTGTAGQQTAQSMLFHPNSVALVTRPLKKLDSAPWSRTYSGNKMSIAGLKYFDGDKRTETLRLDILFGVKTIYPQLGSRLTG